MVVAGWSSITRHIWIPNGNFVAWNAYNCVRLLWKDGRRAWSTSQCIALVLVLVFFLWSGLPLLTDQNGMVMYTPVLCWIVLCSAHKLYSGVEKSSHPRQVVFWLMVTLLATFLELFFKPWTYLFCQMIRWEHWAQENMWVSYAARLWGNQPRHICGDIKEGCRACQFDQRVFLGLVLFSPWEDSNSLVNLT